MGWRSVIGRRVTDPRLYRPPAPVPRGEAATFLSILFGRNFNLLDALPRSAYEMFMGRQTFGKRRMYLVNDPVTIREILVDKESRYPKAAVFVDALSPLLGEGIFISNGSRWRHQREMIRPALSHISLRSAYSHMQAAVDACVERMDAAAARDMPVSLDVELSHVTADVIFRTIFSEPIDSHEAHAVFEAFATIQTLSDQVSVRRILYATRRTGPSRPEAFLAACRRIRDTLGRMVDRRLARGPATACGRRDIADDLAGASDGGTGRGFGRDELVDQIAVFFLAGHETTASLLTWTFVILANVPDVADRIRSEIRDLDLETAGLEPLQNGLPYLRGVLREVLRLYPPVGFITRTPLEPDLVRGFRLQPNDLIVMSPWVLHRHKELWRNPDRFDPERFSSERAGEIARDSYIPFGLGPRVCPGTSFALLESTLIVARLLSRFKVVPIAPGRIAPIGRLTVRPNGSVLCKVTRAA